LERYRQAALRGAAWLLRHQGADGSFSNVDDGVQPYHKIPYALAATGHQREADRLLDWVESHVMAPNGDLKGKHGQAACDWYDRFHTYANSWIVLGAARLGRFPLVRKGIEYILTRQDPNSGGILSEINPHAEHGGRQDIVSTSKAGSACLSAGRIPEAVLMGDWLSKMLESQPEPGTVLYTCWDSNHGLITTFPEEDSLVYAVHANRGLQWFYYPGIAMEFLGRLYRVTRRQQYLEASLRFFDFACRCGEDILRTDPGAIIGSAAALMYQIDGNPHFRDAALVVGDGLVEKQTATGFWFKQDEADTTDPAYHHLLTLEGTAEFVSWLTEMVRWIR